MTKPTIRKTFRKNNKIYLVPNTPSRAEVQKQNKEWNQIQQTKLNRKVLNNQFMDFNHYWTECFNTHGSFIYIWDENKYNQSFLKFIKDV